MENTSSKKIFPIEVWYRFVSNGEQEKEFEIHNIEANTVQEAVNEAEKIYQSFSRIPFKFLHRGERYEPQTLTRNDVFLLTSPTL